MSNSRISLLALLFALGTPLATVAQEAAEAPAAEAPAAGVPAAPTDLSMGNEPAAAAGNEIYVKLNSEAWEVRCEKTSLGADPCQLYQLLKDGEGNSVAEFAMFSLPEGAQGPAVAGANFIAPLETLLTEGMMITIDSAKPRAYPFTFCTQIGCIARLGFTAEDIASFKKGGKATFTILPFVAPDNRVNLEVSLKGFTAAYDAMAEANVAADAAAKKAAEAAKPAQ